MAVFTKDNAAIREFIYLIVIETILSQHPAASDTIIATHSSNIFIIIASDSRTTQMDGKTNDYKRCKITLLDESSFFALAGLMYDTGQPAPFDLRDQAQVHYDPTVSPSSNAETWANAAQSIFTSYPLKWKENLASYLKKKDSGNVVTHGIFGRVSDRTDLVSIDIKYSQTALSTDFSHGAPTELPIGVGLWGSPITMPFVGELLRGDSETAAWWQKTVHRTSTTRGYSESETHAYELKAALERAIALDKDPDIGGDVAVLILDIGRPSSWFAPTSECKG
jgi:hypothetical protein